MRLEQLQYFVQIVESHSFNKASQKLHISQPALTNAIKALEDELNVRLLIRDKKGVVPTSWGARVYEDSKGLLADFNAKVASWKADRAKDAAGGGVVSLVALPSACSYLLEELLPRIREEMENIHIILHEAKLEEFYDALRGGTAHIGVTTFIDEEREKNLRRYSSIGFCAKMLMEDEYSLFLSSRHPLAAKSELTREDCRGLEVATYAYQYSKHDSIFQRLALQLEVTVGYYLDSKESIMQTISQTNAVGFFTRRTMQYNWFVRKGLICARQVQGLRLLPSTHYLLHWENDDLTAAERRVADFIHAHYADESSPPVFFPAGATAQGAACETA